MLNMSLIQGIIEMLTGKSQYSAIPLYKQPGETCTVASLISAILIWNVDQKHTQIEDDPIIVYALNLILIDLEKKGINNESTLYSTFKRLRDSFQKGSICTQEQYTYIVEKLYEYIMLSGVDRTRIIDKIQDILKLAPDLEFHAPPVLNFNEIFSNIVIKDLKKGNISQVVWKNLSGSHAFLIGRLQDGNWFWYDQAGIDTTHAFMLKASSLNILKSRIDGYRINYPDPGVYDGFRGIKLLVPISNMIDSMKDIVPNGNFLAEVDYSSDLGYFGEKLYSNGFESRHYAPFISADYTLEELRYYALEEAKRSADDLRNFGDLGALIVEKPLSVFSVYKTNQVEHDYNTEIIEIDHENSEDGLLADETKFHSAWLRVYSTQGSVSEWFKVY